MNIYNVFNGSSYGLTPAQSIDGTSIVIVQENNIKVVNVFSASSLNESSASASISRISYSSDGNSWSISEETQIQGVTYALYRSVTNVVVGNPNGLIALTIDIPNHTYTNPIYTYRKIEFFIHLDTSDNSHSIDLTDTVKQKGCDIGYRIIYKVENNQDRDLMDMIELNVTCFSGNTSSAFTNPARMQYIVSRETSFDDESDWYDYHASHAYIDNDICMNCDECVRVCNYNAIETDGSLYTVLTGNCVGCSRCVNICPAGAITEIPVGDYTEYKYTSCSGAPNDFNTAKIKTIFPVGRDVVPAGFYNSNYQKKEYFDHYYPDSKAVVLVFDEPITEIGYHTFCFSEHYNCKNAVPSCDSSIETKYIYSGSCSSSLIPGTSITGNTDGKLEGYENVTLYPGIQLEYIFDIANKIKAVILNDYVEIIGNQAFKYLTGLSSFTFGDNSQMKAIGMFAFERDTSLTSITIPNTVQCIGEGAFKYSGLKRVNIPDSLNRIECGVFRGCTALTSVTFTDSASLQKIGTTGFYGCSSLKGITLPNSLARIEKCAFKNCTSLSSVTFGTGLRYIGPHAFQGTSIQTLDLSPCAGSSTNLFILDENALRNLTNLKKVILPDYCKIKSGSLACGLRSISSSNYIELEIGKHTTFSSDAFEYALRVKKLTFRYESASDIEAEEGSAGGTTDWYDLSFPSTDATLYITEYLWDEIKQRPSASNPHYDFFEGMYDRFINGKTRGVFVKNSDGTYSEKFWSNS